MRTVSQTWQQVTRSVSLPIITKQFKWAHYAFNDRPHVHLLTGVLLSIVCRTPVVNKGPVFASIRKTRKFYLVIHTRNP